MTGLHYEDLIQDAGHVGIGGKDVRYASKAALIRLKSASVREKDRLDVLVLQKLQSNPRALD